MTDQITKLFKYDSKFFNDSISVFTDDNSGALANVPVTASVAFFTPLFVA